MRSHLTISTTLEPMHKGVPGEIKASLRFPELFESYLKPIRANSGVLVVAVGLRAFGLVYVL